MNPRLTLAFAVAIPSLVSATAFAASQPPAAATAKNPSISLAAAEKIAETAFPGKILSEELEHEKGGSGLRYSFDIGNGKTVHEVGVDAVTGKLLENDVDNDYQGPPGRRNGQLYGAIGFVG